MRVLICILSLFVIHVPPAFGQMIDLSQRPEGPEMVMKTFISEIAQSPDEAFADLQARAGHLLDLSEVGGTAMAGFSGFETPELLKSYLLEVLPDLPPKFVAKDQPISLSIALIAEEESTLIQVMMAVPQSEEDSLFGKTVPAGGMVLMDDASPADCRGQVVLSQNSPAEAAAQTYSNALETQGFSMSSPDHVKTSFFVGYREDCALFLYIQPDFQAPDRSMVVVRFTED